MEKVIIYGKGRFWQRNAAEIMKRYEVAGILDQNAEDGEYVENNGVQIGVYQPGNIDKLGNYDIIVMIKNFFSAFRKLLDLGVEESRIHFGIEMFPQNENEKLFFCEGEHLYIKDGKLCCLAEGESVVLNDEHEYQEYMKKNLRSKYRKKDPNIAMIANMPVVPVSRVWGMERGKPVDRYYIERFLSEHSQYIRGDVLEIADNSYTRMYGDKNTVKSHILHVMGWGENAIKGNLETGEGICENQYDAMIITQTLMFIYDFKSVAEHIYKALKPGGTALITVAGLSQVSRDDADNWGDFYSFHEDALERIFADVFGRDYIEIKTYGNVKTAMAFLYGLCVEDLKEEDFEYYDPDYQLILTAVVHKKQG